MLRPLAATALLLSGNLADAQVRTIDQGSFTITMNNQRIGREDFSIVETAAPGGPSYLAKATVEYRDRGVRLQPVLTANSAGASTQYELTVRGGPIQKWFGTINRNRVSAIVHSDRGQSAKEFVVSVGAMVLDDDVFHQYYFVAKSSGSAAVVVPQSGTQSTVTVTRSGRERIELGMAQADAEKIVVQGAGPAREVWVDAQGRVLKVAIPSRGIVATRDEVPAGP
ncbi:MAG: hypothetical protein AB1762_11920 [Gemmatimonadota bacterium]